MKNIPHINRQRGFTLIELLTVIAIIGILAAIIIPTVGMVRKQANIAATKSQYSGYVNAMLQFKSEYGYLPSFGATLAGESSPVSLEGGTSRRFIETMSAREIGGGNPTSGDGNRRRISFLSFSDKEFFILPDGTLSDDQLADRFNNTDIEVIIDGNNNGRIRDPEGGTIRTPVGIRSIKDDNEGFPEIRSWE